MSGLLEDGHFLGALKESRQVVGLTLAETTYAPGLQVASHAHDHALCSLVLDGSFTERSGRTSSVCEVGSLIFQPHDEPHAHRFHAGGGRCFNVQFGAGWMERMRGFAVPEPRAPAALHRSRAGWFASQLYQEFTATDSAAPLAIEGLALALLGEIARAGAVSERGAQPRWLLQAVELLRQRQAESIGLSEIAAAVDIDPTHLARTFRRFYGCTMSEYVRRMRIDAAKRVLLGTSAPLSTIAIEAGFADQAHFSRVFKQITGLTPAAFRRASSTG